MAKIKDTDGRLIVATNRKARHDYFLEDLYEAGLVLVGSEVKSIRARSVNIREGYVQIIAGELWLMNVHIADYKQAGPHYGHEPLRPRKLLMHRKEINRLMTKVHERGYALIPTALYMKQGRAKIEIALARGKKQYDKRQSLARRDSDRQVERAMRERNRGDY